MERLYISLENEKLKDLLKNFNNKLWNDFRNGKINDLDEYYTNKHEFEDNSCQNTDDCKDILYGNSEYLNLKHFIFGIPSNYSQAAYCCLYDYLNDHPDTVTWEQMENSLNT